jgi:branched-subunit amino acid transport protein
MTEVVIFVLVGVVTLAMRGVFIVRAGAGELSPRTHEWLDNARPAILAALVAGFLAGGEGSLAVAPIAGVVTAGLVMRRTPNMLLALAAGLAVTMLL